MLLRSLAALDLLRSHAYVRTTLPARRQTRSKARTEHKRAKAIIGGARQATNQDFLHILQGQRRQQHCVSKTSL